VAFWNNLSWLHTWTRQLLEAHRIVAQIGYVSAIEFSCLRLIWETNSDDIRLFQPLATSSYVDVEMSKSKLVADGAALMTDCCSGRRGRHGNRFIWPWLTAHWAVHTQSYHHNKLYALLTDYTHGTDRHHSYDIKRRDLNGVIFMHCLHTIADCLSCAIITETISSSRIKMNIAESYMELFSQRYMIKSEMTWRMAQFVTVVHN